MALLLAALLSFAVLTLWVPGRWAVSVIEAAAYLGACLVLVRQRGRIAISPMVLAPLAMSAWAALQWAAHWSAVPSATQDAWLYWLSAACVVFLAAQVESGVFLKLALGIGFAVCVFGIIQLFTSPGNVFWLFPSGYDKRVIGPFVSPNNYASFVELLIPVALTRRGWQGVCIAAALAASVVASGSRTGAVLVLVEILAVGALRNWGNRKLLAFATLTAALCLVAGQQFLGARFAQKSDALAVRREFLVSSVAMFRAQPLHGFGLGTWPSTYPQFATIDTGEVANHAHNEWAQWAAEGGIPALALMLGILLFTARPALGSVWGIGILAVFAHSLVDYPFLRLGLAVWIFAFLGALTRGALRKNRAVTVRERPFQRATHNWSAALAIPVLLLAACQTVKLAYADSLYRRATPQSVAKAALLEPARAEYHFALAQLDSAHAAAHLEQALAANPYDSRARIGLALEREAAGDTKGAAQLLLETARKDHQFAPVWALANFYFRSRDSDGFWLWAGKSAAVSYGDRRAFFDLCFLVSSNAHVVFEQVVTSHPALEQPFLAYLVAQHRIRDAAEVAEAIARRSSPAPETVLDYIDAAIDAGERASAWRVQTKLARKPQLLLNGDFSGPLLNRGFDWKPAAAEGVSITRLPNAGPALSIELSGRQPEACELLTHALALEPGVGHVLSFEYRTEGLPTHTGLAWSVNADSRKTIQLDQAPDWKSVAYEFTADTQNTLRLVYHRLPGTTRTEGSVLLRKVQIQIAPYRLASHDR